MQYTPIYRPFETTVKCIADVTPRMRRVTLSGDDLGHFSTERPGQWVKLFFDNSGHGRAFTIRRWRPEQREIDIDFVVHENGLAGRWLASARPGLEVRIAGPRSAFMHTPGKHLFLFGDETAIPAIAAILEAMDPAERAVVVVEIATPDAVQPLPTSPNTHISWIISQRIPGLQLAAHAKALTLNPESSQVWVGCEATSARDLRRAFGQLGFDRSDLHVSGYWKHGESEHVDHDSDY